MGDQLRASLPFKILVVEDQPPLREALVEAMQAAFADLLVIHEAGSGNAAIQMLGSETYSVVVSDLDMPGGTGLDVGQYLEGLSTKPFLIFFSGTGGLAFPFHGDHFLGHVQKPFTQKLFQKIRTCLCLE